MGREGKGGQEVSAKAVAAVYRTTVEVCIFVVWWEVGGWIVGGRKD